ncbi:hypothetical protein TRFO_15377 [Tritrichomonas foetus]|uniref:Uncharacterized protein n=1 Tax=Tritrichomonas foetus TaxID=1144522 RepID=A0A1J4KST7_9EUKA|nr:hypothetical protein TRFO_15377 [Tritrichomonas foetus]|eukprot:OHT14323.1 hypothetical protein TRFO_15377 [Tritrichomonas foetus]
MRAKTAQSQHRPVKGASRLKQTRPDTQLFTTRSRKSNRPATSIINRPVKRRQPYKPEEIDFYVGVDTERFGDGPKIAIKSSRKPPKIPPPTPAPGDYEVPAAPIDKRLKPTMPNTIHGEIIAPMTTNIDYIDSTIFPANIPKGIGSLDNQKFFQIYDVPPCKYIPRTNFTKNTIKIGDKKPTVYENGNPGPGQYTPDFVLRRNPKFQFTCPTIRCEWLMDRRNNPPPDIYEPKKVEKQAPIYSIGDKSRKRKRKKITPFPLGSFIVKLDESITLEEAREYTIKHPNFKTIVAEMLDHVLEIKPENPLLCLREFWFEIKEMRDRNSQPVSTDEYDLNQILIQIREPPPKFVY